MIKVMDNYRRLGGRRGKKKWLAVPLVLLLVAAYCGWAVRRPLPPLEATQSSAFARAAVPDGKDLAWPAGGQAAVGIAGTKIVETHGKQTGVPTASTAKLITVLCVLQKKPLAPGEQGPTITLTQDDVNLYNDYYAKNGSLVPVKAGEKITEYQALQAILLPSANNMADSLAIWAFGSLKNYSKFANEYVKDLGLTATHVGPDASGFDPRTVSSARDLVKLGKLAMENPVLSKIVGQKTASGIPVANKIRNVNFLLGTSGIIGVKTGDTDQAGGVFVGAAKKQVNGKQAVIVTAVTHSHDIFSALKTSLVLIKSAQANFHKTTVIKAGTIVGRYEMPWGGSILAAADQTLDAEGWDGGGVPFTVNLEPISTGIAPGAAVGTVTVKDSALTLKKSVPVKLQGAPYSPSAGWRLLHLY
jgi:D-alanyl-D-alanine carboxypeptidase (penicillin-binding protein 5/6)